MRRYILILILSLITLGSYAQQHHRPSFEDFQNKKLEFIVKEMGLNDSEVAKFSPIYKELGAERTALYAKYRNNNSVKRAMRSGEQVADTTMQRVSRDDAQLQVEDAQLEQKYQQKFEEILTPQQVIKWREAEQKFRDDIMSRRQHNRERQRPRRM